MSGSSVTLNNHIMKIMQSVCIYSVLLLCSTIVSGQSAESEEFRALQALDDLLAGIETMTADVSQMIVESDGGVLEQSNIHMKMKRPQGFYWETLSPFPELIVTDGESLWNYQPDLEQVVIENWDASRSELAAQLLSGDTSNLSEEYRLSIRNTEKTEFTDFILIPREADNIYRQISLTFRGPTLDMIHIDSANGQKTVWQFTDIRSNEPLADGEFRFQPPAGVEIIQNNYVP